MTNEVAAPAAWTTLRDVRKAAIERYRQYNGGNEPLAREEAERAIFRGLCEATISAKGADYQLHVVTEEGNFDYPVAANSAAAVPPIFWNLWVQATIGALGKSNIDWIRGFLSFQVSAGDKAYFDGRIDRLELSGAGLATILDSATRAQITFTDAERKAWIKDQSNMTADAAHKLFKAHPQYDGTKQAEFRKEWKALRGTKPGRPALNS